MLLLSAHSEPGCGYEKGQGWHVPYGILRWGMEAAVLPRDGSTSEHFVGTGQGQAFSPTSDPGTYHIPVWRLQYPSRLGWSSGAVEGDAWLDFPAPGQGTVSAWLLAGGET